MRFYGRVPGNPGNNCPAVFRDEDTGGFYFQGKTVVAREVLGRLPFGPAADDESVVWLPASMVEIILTACRADLDAQANPTAGRSVFRDSGTGDFYFQGKTVVDPEVLVKISSDSPILDDESIVWLPSSTVGTIVEACRAGDIVR